MTLGMSFPILVILVVGATLTKRAFLGPQPAFARVSLVLVLSGIGMRTLATAPTDPVSWIATWLFVSGLLLTMTMMIAELSWRVRTVKIKGRKR